MVSKNIPKRKFQPVFEIHKIFRKYRKYRYIGSYVNLVYMNPYLSCYMFVLTLIFVKRLFCSYRDLINIMMVKEKFRRLEFQANNERYFPSEKEKLLMLLGARIIEYSSFGRRADETDAQLRIRYLSPIYPSLFNKTYELVNMEQIIEKDFVVDLSEISEECNKAVSAIRSLSDCEVVSAQLNQDYDLIQDKISCNPSSFDEEKYSILEKIRYFSASSVKFVENSLKLGWLTSINKLKKIDDFFLVAGKYHLPVYLQNKIFCHLLNISADDREIFMIEAAFNQSIVKTLTICAKADKNAKKNEFF